MRRRLVLSLMLLLASCAPPPRETGVLQGHVTVGPLLPVVREGGPEPTPAPEVYAIRQMVIYAEDGRTEVTRVQIDAQGNYRVTLPVRTYVADINHVGIDRGSDLTATVRIYAGPPTRLDVGIDRGIRRRTGPRSVAAPARLAEEGLNQVLKPRLKRSNAAARHSTCLQPCEPDCCDGCLCHQLVVMSWSTRRS